MHGVGEVHRGDGSEEGIERARMELTPSGGPVSEDTWT